jgi:hypothetical protein
LYCKGCGEELDPRRVELGYDYCMKSSCQRQHLKPLRLARVGVNKAADQFVRADDVLPAAPGTRYTTMVEEESTHGDRPARTPASREPTPRPTTTTRLRAAERRLDARLERSYERFCAGETTATEMNRERNALIDEFNALVRTENIRYRSLLRRRF